MKEIFAPACLALTGLLLFAGPGYADPGKKQVHVAPSNRLPFKSGEKLVYDISWSNVLKAGTAVMEVRKEADDQGKTDYRICSTARSTGLVSKFYKVSDTIVSVIDSDKLYSKSFQLDQLHGKRKRKREMTFDPRHHTVSVISDGQKASYQVPDNVQDSLSSLYYVRSRQDFIVNKPIIVNVHEDGKTWSVEVQTLGREKVRTPVGEFNTIKVKTYPRYEGVFQNKGEIYIWFTDDDRRIPVLMKSTISIGSIVSTLVEMRNGEERNDFPEAIKTSHHVR